MLTGGKSVKDVLTLYILRFPLEDPLSASSFLPIEYKYIHYKLVLEQEETLAPSNNYEIYNFFAVDNGVIVKYN